ncbi:ArsR/SmtB family transcription factor [Glaciihabitans tibetensis]|nr:metalloregulator ArsR/SmtB family transcription factor [Glaciihabitans tibetensis]
MVVGIEAPQGSKVADRIENADVDLLFHALADSTRRDIIARTIEREQSVSSLAEHYAMSFAAVQKHVAVLQRASLVTKEKRGREQIVYGNPSTLRVASHLIKAYEDLWNQRALRMAQILSADDHPKEATKEQTDK